MKMFSLCVLFSAMQYDDYEDSEGVTSEGED